MARNSLWKKRWNVYEHAPEVMFLFLSANRQPGKKWKKRKRLGFCSSLATRKNLIMCASAVKSHNGRREHRACLGRREALVTPSPGEILFPAGDSVVFSEQRPPSAISSFSFSLSSRGKFHLWSTELRREQRRRTNGESWSFIFLKVNIFVNFYFLEDREKY